VRFIDAFVDRLDLAAVSFSRVEPKMTGRPGYAPADLLKPHLGLPEPGAVELSVGGETHRHIKVIWLPRHLKPDFETIAEFRCGNRNAFRQTFRL
jgi:hypothetical protein